jgi:protein-disulfide isomerase
MQNIKTETKVIIGVLALTAIIIFGGITLFKTQNSNQEPGDYSKYIITGLDLDKTKISRPENPKITGTSIASSTASSTKINITEFMDYECPACATNGEDINDKLLALYGDKIIITRKIFPVHGQASIDVGGIVLASQIFGTDVYEKVHKKVLETQEQWAILGKKDREDFIKKMIIDLGIDYDKVFTESKNEKYAAQIMQDKQDALELGITATPSYIIENHTRITGGLPVDEIVKYMY